MRRIISLVLVGLMAVASTCCAAGGAEALKKLEKVGDRIANAFAEKNPTPFGEYKSYFAGFNGSEAETKQLRENIIRECGPMVGYRLEDFHREPDHDNLGYLLTCAARNRMIRLELDFDKDGKIIGMRVAPMEIVEIGAKNKKK